MRGLEVSSPCAGRRGRVSPLRAPVLLLLLPALAQGAETVRIAMGERAGPVTLKGRNLAAGPDTEDGPFTPLGAGEAAFASSRGAWR